MPMEAGAGKEGEAAAAAVVARRRGCIRSTRGPWTVRRRGRGGGVTTSLRHPTPRERENNRERERRRRQVATRIYAGLRTHAGYTLPKHADQNDVLRALCAEAGYHVDDDGNITRRGEVSSCSFYVHASFSQRASFFAVHANLCFSVFGWVAFFSGLLFLEKKYICG